MKTNTCYLGILNRLQISQRVAAVEAIHQTSVVITLFQDERWSERDVSSGKKNGVTPSEKPTTQHTASIQLSVALFYRTTHSQLHGADFLQGSVA